MKFIQMYELFESLIEIYLILHFEPVYNYAYPQAFFNVLFLMSSFFLDHQMDLKDVDVFPIHYKAG